MSTLQHYKNNSDANLLGLAEQFCIAVTIRDGREGGEQESESERARESEQERARERARE
jgi:hypothetical protein